MMQQDLPWNTTTRASKSAPCSPIKPMVAPPPHRSESFHIAHKVPVGDTPYVKAKRVQLVEKDPDRAIALFWAAINAGDRVDSALKDMAIVMKQQNRAEEAIEAIKSLRNRCTDQAQESLDNILLDLYKRCGRLDDQITLLKHKLNLIQQGLAFNGRRTKTARSQGRKFQVSVDQEATRLLGNLGWALMQQDNYIEAEAAYRRALLIGADNNKMCNLGICLMKQGRISEAKATLKQVKPAVADGPRGVDSHLKAFERAQEMLRDLESKISVIGAGIGEWRSDQRLTFDATAFLGSIWQPQPCLDSSSSSSSSSSSLNHPIETFSDENLKPDSNLGNSLNVFAPPFYSKQVQVHDPLGKLKRTRSVAAETKKPPLAPPPPRQQHKEESKEESKAATRRSLSFDQTETTATSTDNKWIVDLLPDNETFEEAIVAAVLAPILEVADATIAEGDKKSSSSSSSPLCEEKVGKRLRVFQDITQKSLIRSSRR